MLSTTSAVLRPSHLSELELHRPVELAELLELIAAGVEPLAGGTDVLLWASQGGGHERLAWTGGVDGLHEFDPDGERIRVGAAVALSRLVRSKAFRAGAPAVAEGAQVIGSVQIRNQATLIGNLCTASPAGDSIPGLMVHDAEVEIIGPAEARRNLNISDFLLAPGRTVLGAGELVAALIVCRLGAREFSTYRSFTERRALDLAFAGVAARLGFEEDGRTVKSARLALGAVGPTVIDALEAANILQGQEIGEDVVRRCAQAAADVCSPISDHRASADYRRHLIKVLVGDCLSELDAQRRAAGGDG